MSLGFVNSIKPWVNTVTVKFGEALTECRERKNYANQTEAAKASEALASEHPGIFVGFSQQWLSRLEGDRTGELIDRANRPRLRTLAYLLGLNGPAFETRIGIPIGTVPLLDNSSPEQQAAPWQVYNVNKPIKGDLALLPEDGAKLAIDPNADDATEGLLLYKVGAGDYVILRSHNPLRPSTGLIGKVVLVELK